MQCYRFSLLIGLVEQNVTQDVNILCISVSSACSHPWMLSLIHISEPTRPY